MSAHVPVLVLDPVDDAFESKIIPLRGVAIRIGRQLGDSTAPTTENGSFASKLLSRRHAEIWAQDGKIWIRDTRSSNGTFVNSRRLSTEGLLSEPCELKTGDVIELGAGVTEPEVLSHHPIIKARVSCVFPPPPPLRLDGWNDGQAGVDYDSRDAEELTETARSQHVAAPRPREAVLHIVYVGKRRES